jgi:hypothetical protein
LTLCSLIPTTKLPTCQSHRRCGSKRTIRSACVNSLCLNLHVRLFFKTRRSYQHCRQWWRWD